MQTLSFAIFTKKKEDIPVCIGLSIDNTLSLLLWKFETAVLLLIQITSDQTQCPELGVVWSCPQFPEQTPLYHMVFVYSRVYYSA